MITLLLGRSGSGKTGRLMSAIAENAKNNISGQLLIVPPQFTHETERRLCASAGDDVCLYAEAMSFERLCSRVFSNRGGAATKTLDLPGRLLLMRLAVKSVEDKLAVCTGLSRPHSLKAALDMADELKSYGLGPETLAQAADSAEGSLARKLRDASLICAAYDSLLCGGLSDRQEDMVRLCRQLDKSDFAKGRRVFIDGFSWFTALELDVIYHLAAGGAEVTISITWDEEDEAFNLQRRAVGSVRRLAQRLGQDLKIDFAEITGNKSADLQYLEKNFFKQEAAPYPTPAENIELYIADDPFAECRLAAAKALSLVRQEGLRWRDIVVACRGMESYAPMLERVFAWEGVPLFISGSAAFGEKPESAFIFSAMDAAEGGFEQEDVFGMLKTGLAGLDPAQVDILENYARLWDLRGAFWTRDTDWRFHPVGFAMEADEDSEQKLEEINTIKRKIQRPLALLARAAKKSGSARDHATALFDFLQACSFPQQLENRRQALIGENKLAQAGECAQLWRIICGVLDESVDILGDDKLDFVEYSRLLRLMLSGCSISTIPPSLDTVTASDISLLGQKDIKALILIGARDGALPAVTETPGLFTESERRGLARLDINLGSAGERLLEAEMSFIYSVLAKPKKTIIVSRPLSGSSGEEAAPSFVFTRLSELFNLLPKTFSRWEEIPGAITAAGAFRMAFSTNPQAASAAAEALQTAGDDGGLLGLRDAALTSREPLGRAGAAALYGETLFLTPSRAETFALCPFSYFMAYGLKAKEERAAGFDASQIGVFTHYLLENTFRDAQAAGGFKSFPPEKIRALTEKYTLSFVEDRLDDFKDKSPRFKHLFMRQAGAAEAIVCDAAGELALSDFAPVRFELRFGLPGEDGSPSLPPVVISGANMSLSVVGVADRVDAWEHEGQVYLRVVDYKTGVKDFHLSDLRHGLNLQLLIYLFALADRGQSLFGKAAVPAGALYCPARRAEADAKNGLSDPDPVDAIRRSGIILGQPEVVSAMERDISGQAVYLPVKEKGGSYSGALADSEQMTRLRRLVEDVVLSLGQRVTEGDISVSPGVSGQRDPCRWCPYKAACGFDDASGDRKRKLDKISDTRFWQLLEETYSDSDAGPDTEVTGLNDPPPSCAQH